MSTSTADSATGLTGTRVWIDVELVYARPESVWRHTLQLAPHSTVQDALELSDFFEQFRDYCIDTVRVGIYGQSCPLNRPLQQDDRIEIYRELDFDPMESRRR